MLRDLVETDIASGEDDSAAVGIRAFDDLTSEQKLALLADVAEALRYPSVPSPDLTAANEATVAAVIATFKSMLATEIEADSTKRRKRRTALRRLLLRAIGHIEDLEEPLPVEDEVDPDEWAFVLEILEGRIFWDDDFTMDDKFLDLPSDKARAHLEFHGIDPDYFLSIPPEPDRAGLEDVRRRLAKIQGLREPSE